jgi:hypothetical protein
MPRPRKTPPDYNYYIPKRDCHHLTLDEVAEKVGISRQQVYCTENVGMVKLIKGLMDSKELQEFYSNDLLHLLTAFCSTTSIPHSVAGKAVATILKRHPQYKTLWHLEEIK